jgi:hypothetical protein
LHPTLLKPASLGLSLGLLCSGQGLSAQEPPASAKPTLLFQTGFEEEVRLSANPTASDTFSGVDRTVAAPNDWGIFRTKDPQVIFAGVSVAYSGGVRENRKGEIVADPVDSKNRVLRFWLNEANSKTSGRIQADVTVRANRGIRNLYEKVRLYVPESMKALQNFPDEISHLIIAEFWNNIPWSKLSPEYPFRVSVRMGKKKGAGNELHFVVTTNEFTCVGEGENRKYTQVGLKTIDSSVPVAFGKWMTLEYYLQEGAAAGELPAGHFFMAVTPVGEARRVVCSLKASMHHSADTRPDGLTHWAAMKLYTGGNIIAWMKSHGLAMELYYDDLQIWELKVPNQDFHGSEPR